jgi:hypothetical protein
VGWALYRLLVLGSHLVSQKMDTQFTRQKLQQKNLTQIFQDLEGEIAPLTATAKFEYATNKITENDLKLKLAYIEGTKKLAAILKTRIALLIEATN